MSIFIEIVGDLKLTFTSAEQVKSFESKLLSWIHSLWRTGRFFFDTRTHGSSLSERTGAFNCYFPGISRIVSNEITDDVFLLLPYDDAIVLENDVDKQESSHSSIRRFKLPEFATDDSVIILDSPPSTPDPSSNDAPFN